MAEQEEPQLSPRAQIKRVLRVAFRAIRYWPVVVIAATLAIAAGLLIPKMLRPVYSSETVLLYREVIQARSVVGQETAGAGLGRNGGRRLREMLLSRTNLEEIVKELNLYPNTVSSLGMIEAINELRRNADCAVGRADSFTITFQGEDPDLVFRVTERLANSLIEQSSRYRSKQADSTKEFLQAQYERTQQDLRGKEQQLAVFLAKHPEFAQASTPGVVTAPGVSIRAAQAPGAPRTPAPRPVSSNPAVNALERQASRLRQQLAADRNPRPSPVVIAPVPKVDPETQRRIRIAEEDFARATRNLAQARASKTESHPDVVAARGRLLSAKTSLNALKASAASTTPPPPSTTPVPNVVLSEKDKQRLRAQLRAVDEKIKAARGASNSGVPTPVDTAADGDAIVALETQWTTLMRDVSAVRERNSGLQRLLFSANIIATIESSGDAAQMIVIDPPYKPTRPTKRGTRRVAAVASFMVLMMGCAAAVALAFLDDRVYDVVDLERLHIGKLSHGIPMASRTPRGMTAAGANTTRGKGAPS